MYDASRAGSHPPPRLLDLFCGAGGAAVGYTRAGFEVIGVDSQAQRRYPYTFYQEDALSVLDILLAGSEWHGYHLSDFAVIHASPPCQGYSRSRFIAKVAAQREITYSLLIGPVRERLQATGLPWVIENVAGSPLSDALQLCGSMVGLPLLRRHRWFSCSHMLFAPNPCKHASGCINPVGGKIRGYGSLSSKKTYLDGKGRTRKREGYYTLLVGQKVMGIDWMTIAELCQAIPPAYTEWIGHQLMDLILSSALHKL